MSFEFPYSLSEYVDKMRSTLSDEFRPLLNELSNTLELRDDDLTDYINKNKTDPTSDLWNMPWGVVARVKSTGAGVTISSNTQVSFEATAAFTPMASRVYRITYAVGYVINNAGGFNQEVRIRLGSVAGTILDTWLLSSSGAAFAISPSKTALFAAGELGTVSTAIHLLVYANGGNCTFLSSAVLPTSVIVEDIGPA